MPRPKDKTVKRRVSKDARLINRQTWTAPDALDADLLLDGQVVTSASRTFTTFLAQPDYARQLSLIAKTNTGDVPAGDVVITGTDIDGNVITDTLTFTANQATAENTVKAFKTVTQIAFPAPDGDTATWDLGTTDALGLEERLDGDTILYANHTGTRETTHPTLVSNSTDKTKNLITLNTALDGSGDVEVAYIYPFPPS
jgi:hypothetical protein